MEGDSGTWWLLVALFAGAIGMGMIIYGRKQRDALTLVFGVAMAAYPYAVSSALVALGVGAGIMVAFTLLKKYR